MVSNGLQVLELNADFMPLNLVPLSTITWQEAMKKVYEGVAIPISYHEGEIVRTPSQEFKVPSVIIMKDFKHLKKHAKYSKYNVKLRDGFKCQYCGKRFSAKALTIDHVIPKAKGGRLTWDNSVAACKTCNNKKGDQYWKPKRQPYRPNYYELAKKKFAVDSITNEDWIPYFKFLESKNKT